MQNLDKILEGIECEEILGKRDLEIALLESDSRKVVPGTLFFALRGTISDGHDYIKKSVLSGAVAIVCENLPGNPDQDITWIRVKDSHKALGLAASAFYGHPSRRLKLTGITGTNGKTTTATLLYQMFSRLGYNAGLISTIRYSINGRDSIATHTTPDPIRLNRMLAEMVSGGCSHCFMEVSSHAIVQQRIAGLHFTGGIFTNISHDHLDYHGTFSEYLKVKKHFFDILSSKGFALINKDDRNSGYMVQNTKARVITYALKTMADFKGSIREIHPAGMQLVISGKEVWTNFIGGFNACNILAVFACSILLDVNEDDALGIISLFDPVEGRFETIRSSNNVTAIVDYAHTPDALANVIEAVRQLLGPDGRLITVTGAGGDRDKDKRPVMARIAAEKSHRVIITSDNPRSEDPVNIINDMMAGVEEGLKSKVLCITARDEAIRAACMFAEPGDFVLVAGKGHETYQEIMGIKHHFDDREVVRSVLGSDLLLKF